MEPGGIQRRRESSVAVENRTQEQQLLMADARASFSSQEERYRRQLEAVCNNATLALFIIDEHQQCSYMNPAAEKLTGYTLKEVQGHPLHDFVHHTRPDGRPYPLDECPIDQVLSRNSRQQGEETFVHKDGTFYPVAFTASPIGEAGVPGGTIIEVRDTTLDKQAEQALKLVHDELEKMVEQRTAELAEANQHLEEQIARLKEVEMALTANESQLKAAQRIAHLGSWERDLSTNVISASVELRQIYGVDPPDSADAFKIFFDRVHPDDQDLLRNLTQKGLRDQDPFDLEYRIIRPDGSLRMIHLRGEVIADEFGEPIRVR
jgi:PAS domain S-box-containing protein